MSIDIDKLTDEEVRALKARFDSLPPPAPPKPHPPWDPTEKMTAIGAQVDRYGRLPEWMRDMMAVDTRGIVEDARRSSPTVPSSPVPKEAVRAPAARHSGWSPALPMTPPPGVDHVDRLCAADSRRITLERFNAMSAVEQAEAIRQLEAEIAAREGKGGG
jgi:hypothetical protein